MRNGGADRKGVEGECKDGAELEDRAGFGDGMG